MDAGQHPDATALAEEDGVLAVVYVEAGGKDCRAGGDVQEPGGGMLPLADGGCLVRDCAAAEDL